MHIEYSLSGEINYVNQLGLELLGYSTDELIGKPQSVLMDADELQNLNYSRMWQEIAGGQVRERCHRYVGKDGNVVWLQSSFLPVRDPNGEVVSAVQVGMNITSQQQRDAESGSIFSALHESMSVAEFEVDGTIRHVNEKFLKSLGYEERKISGKHHSILCGQDHAESVNYQHFWEQLRAGIPSYGAFEYLRKDGSKVWFESTYAPIVDEQGSVERVIEFGRDVTEINRQRSQLISVLKAIDTHQVVGKRFLSDGVDFSD